MQHAQSGRRTRSTLAWRRSYTISACALARHKAKVKIANEIERKEQEATRGLIEAASVECPNVGVSAAEAWILAYGVAWERLQQAQGAEEQPEQVDEQLEQAKCVEEEQPGDMDVNLGGGGLLAEELGEYDVGDYSEGAEFAILLRLAAGLHLLDAWRRHRLLRRRCGR